MAVQLPCPALKVWARVMLIKNMNITDRSLGLVSLFFYSIFSALGDLYRDFSWMLRCSCILFCRGEISVICQDVRLLKEKFDDRVPLSKSLSSSQTSCILASSSSSLKSLVPDSDQVAVDQTNLSGQQKMDSTSAEETRNNCKALMEDGWEIFDNRELCM